MKRNVLIASALALVFAFASLPANAAALKIGAVNLPVLVSKSPQAKKARQQMKSKFSARKKKLEDRHDDLKKKVQRLKRDGSVMSDDARQTLAKQVRDEQRHLKLDQSVYQEDVKEAESKVMQSMRQTFSKVIDDYATSNNYDLILSTGVVYASDPVDITDKILERLKKEN